jgi:hypothetical protein
MAKQSKAPPLPSAAICPAHMVPATVLWYDPRHGTGRARTKAGVILRIPFQAMQDAKLVALEQGSLLFVELDHHNQTRIESLRLVE